MPSPLHLLLTPQLLAFAAIAIILLAVAAISLLISRQGPVYSDADHITGGRARVLRDEIHGFSGKPDYIWREKGRLVPEEIKSGACGPTPRHDNVIQMGVYFFLIEAQLNERPQGGRLKYRNRTFWIENTEDLRAEVLALRDRYEGVQAGLLTPAPHPQPRVCSRCAFQGQCPDAAITRQGAPFLGPRGR